MEKKNKKKGINTTTLTKIRAILNETPQTPTEIQKKAGLNYYSTILSLNFLLGLNLVQKITNGYTSFYISKPELNSSIEAS